MTKPVRKHRQAIASKGLQRTLQELDKCPAVKGSLRHSSDNSDALLYVFAFVQIFSIAFGPWGVGLASLVFGAVLLGLANQDVLLLPQEARWPRRFLLAATWLGGITGIYLALRLVSSWLLPGEGMWHSAIGMLAMALAYLFYRSVSKRLA